MEQQMQPKSEAIMCGDHPSFQQKEMKKKLSANDIESRLPSANFMRLEPSTSRMANGTLEPTMESRRRTRSIEMVNTQDVDALMPPGNRTFLKAALGSSRWPPYLLCVWVIVLLLTHALHCVVALLDRALPAFKKTCTFFRNWTEDSWKSNTERDLNSKITTVGLSLLTALLYVTYFALYSVYAIAVWSVEPLSTETDESKDGEAKITTYADDINLDCCSK